MICTTSADAVFFLLHPQKLLMQAHFVPFLALSLTRFPRKELFQSSDKEMVLFLHDAGPAVYDTLLGSKEASTTPSAQITILARLDSTHGISL